MAEIKYVAAGFLNDAEKLIRDFVKENSMEFSTFAEVWKRHNFSLIYACRPKGRELREFTIEIFQLCFNFLKSSSLLYQIGGTFLMYALYRNQILAPFLKIRIESAQFKTILVLLDMSRVENCRSMHYVIRYLLKNSFDFVACSKLKGPQSIRNDIYKDNDECHLRIQESDLKHELTEIAKTNVLHEFDDLLTQYEKLLDSFNMPFVETTVEHPPLKDFARSINKLLNDHDDCANPKDSSSLPCEAKEGSANPKDASSLPCQAKEGSVIGSRRALLKASAFSNPVFNYRSHGENNATTSCVSDVLESAGEVPSMPPARTAVRKKRRVRRIKKVGRPKKFVSEDSMSEEELQQSTVKSVLEKGLSGRRRRPRGLQFTKIRHYYADDYADLDDLNLPSTSSYLPKEEYVFSGDSDKSEQF